MVNKAAAVGSCEGGADHGGSLSAWSVYRGLSSGDVFHVKQELFEAENAQFIVKMYSL